MLLGTDASQGRGQILSNINACLAVQDTIKGTLGPYGGDLLLVDGNGRQTITNDGATVMKVCFRRFGRASFGHNKTDKPPFSSSILFIPPLESSQILHVLKMRKSVTVQLQLWLLQAKF
jgi:hypothetical protein